MRILVLGIGRQGRAALHDLAGQQDVEHVIAADSNISGAVDFIARLRSPKIEALQLDVSDRAAVATLMARVDAVVNLLPPSFQGYVARLAVDAGIHAVDTSYATPEMKALAAEAEAKGLTLLPEFGFDPGIDLMMAGEGARELDSVDTYYSYGTGIPEPTAAATSPIQYKISWTTAGVLRAYKRDTVIVREGEVVSIPGGEIFAPENIGEVSLAGYGPMESYFNGNVVPFLERMGIRATTRNAGRLTTRWPGHCKFWYALSKLGFLEEQPIDVDGAPVAPVALVRSILDLPQHQYADDERDLAITVVDMRGMKDGRRVRLLYEMADLRDLDTGLLAMNRTVGYTCTIGALMILRGQIAKRGVLSPITDVAYAPFVGELTARGIHVKRTEEPC